MAKKTPSLAIGRGEKLPVSKGAGLTAKGRACELCKIDILFPPNELWVEYYGVKDVRDIITLTNKKKKMGAIL